MTTTEKVTPTHQLVRSVLKKGGFDLGRSVVRKVGSDFLGDVELQKFESCLQGDGVQVTSHKGTTESVQRLFDFLTTSFPTFRVVLEKSRGLLTDGKVVLVLGEEPKLD